MAEALPRYTECYRMREEILQAEMREEILQAETDEEILQAETDEEILQLTSSMCSFCWPDPDIWGQLTNSEEEYQAGYDDCC
eukprot:COSAG01_NODE_2037_length_8579_cov_119.860849_4_plen_82_part_00